jgi:uncharacterized protein YaaN involved in tellurite resistance
MVTEQPEQPADPGTAVVPVERTLPAEAGPIAPKELSDEEVQKLRTRASDIVKEVEAASGSKEMELSDSITAIGIQAQRTAGSNLSLLRTRVGDMLSDDATGNRVTQDLVDLRQALNEINPAETRGPLARILSMLPFGEKVLDRLERIAVRYEPVSKQVVVIERRLDEGRLMLVRDNIELRKLYEQVESQQLPLKRNANLGEVLMDQLQALIDRTDDPTKKGRIQNLLYDLSIRVQDLRSMEEVNNQFFVSIEMTRENNTRLGQAVDRTLALATNTLMVGLAIQSALARQKRVLEATERTREFLGELITTNAAAIRQHTAEIGDVYSNPVIAMDKLQQAHDDLIAALDTATRLKTEGIDTARQNIAKLRELTGQIEEKVTGLPEKDDTRSLEA